MAFKARYNKKVNVGRVISKIVITALAMYVGDKILAAVASTMNDTQSIFYQGFSFLGFGMENSTHGTTGPG